LYLAAQVLLDVGQRVVVENPGYLGARAALCAAGVRLVPIEVDSEGAQFGGRQPTRPRARAAYVTPSHQFPLGSTMSLKRRLALLEWARANDAWIFEDDYDSEYRYTGRPLASLQGLDVHNRVIYMGTFSKVMFPALRLGFLVVPSHLSESFAAARAVGDRHSPTVEQAALADFIAEGHFARHVRRMRVIYAQRQAALLDAARRYVDGLVALQPAHAGMHLVGFLSPGIDDCEVARRAAAKGIGVAPLSPYYLGNPVKRGLVIGFAGSTSMEIENSIRELARILSSIGHAKAIADQEMTGE